MGKIDKLWFLIPAGLLVIALFPLPYGYYQILRIVVAIASGFIAFNAFKEGNRTWLIVFGSVCVLFNPLIPVYLSRELWMPIDVVTAVLFVGGLRATLKP